MPNFSDTDWAHMARALKLAERGRFGAHPNPVVGCVLVSNGEVIAEGWHQEFGGAHAEAAALNIAGERARGSTAYVTLEPCAHHGKTPPCADALIEAGVERVVIAAGDPFTTESGRGLQKLVDAGIDVDTGLLESPAQLLNRGFLKRVTTGRPFVRLKIAASLDGAIAMKNGQSQWITGPQAREDVHRLRAQSGAIMTGIGTVLADDPALTARLANDVPSVRQPLRVVLDSQLRMPVRAAMLGLPGHTLVCCLEGADTARLDVSDAEVLTVAKRGNRIDIGAVLDELASRSVNEVLVEAGPQVAGALVEHEWVDELVIYQAPHIMGSQTQRMFETPGWLDLADSRRLEVNDVRRLGNDTRITAYIKARQ